MKEKIYQFLSVFVLIVYIFSFLFQSLPFVNLVDDVYAENIVSKDNLVLVLVDSKIYNADKDDINWYASYIQQTNKNTKAIVFPIDTKYVKAPDIVKVIDNIYFNGEKTKTSFLKTIVLIGNVPLPVVNKDGYIFSSIYPYVDVVKPAFKWDGHYFEYTGKPSNVELSHGVIKFSNIEDYKKYFQKLKTYAQNPKDFVDRKFYIDDFDGLAKSLNSNLLKYYLNKLIFAENLITSKISPLLLDYFSNQYKKGGEELKNDLQQSAQINQVETNNSSLAQALGFSSTDMKKFENIEKQYNQKFQTFSQKFSSVIDKMQKQSNPYWQMPTKLLESSLKNFFRNFSQLFGNEFASNISDNLQATARYNWNNTNSVINLIDIKDTISVNYLNAVNKKLEKAVDKSISDNHYFMYYPVMVDYIKGAGTYTDAEGYSHADCYRKYETFFFGENVKNINDIKGLSIYRGSFANYTGLNVLSSLASRGNISTQALFGKLFSYQVEANRAYNNISNASKDGEHFKNSCHRIYGACADLGRNSNSESISHWAKRLYGGYSPLNVNTNSSFNNPFKLNLNYQNFKYAWHPIETPAKNGSLYDTGGSVFVNQKKVTDNIFDVISNYNSVWKTLYYKEVYNWDDMGGYYTCSSNPTYLDGSSKISGTYYDYLKNFNQICSTARCNGYLINSSKPCVANLNGKYLTLTTYESYSYMCGGESDTTCCAYKKKQTTTYKFIDTRYKHTSPTNAEISGMNLSTRARPVDGVNYISFLGVGGDTIKLDYPDIFNVPVYKNENGKLVLKNPNEIAQSIKIYLKRVVKNYNNKLKAELDKKTNFYNKYKAAWDKISNSQYKPHSYNLLPEDYLINQIGSDKISNIAEMLYYLNLGWSQKPVSSNLSGELNNLYKSFNVFEKVKYLVKNYVDTEDKYNVLNKDISHSSVNFPFKAQKGYEAGAILSNGGLGNINLENQQAQLQANNLLSQAQNGLFSNLKEATKKECGYPLGQPVILWKWPSAFMCRLQETLKKPFKIISTNSCANIVSNNLLAFGKWQTKNKDKFLSKCEKELLSIISTIKEKNSIAYQKIVEEYKKLKESANFNCSDFISNNEILQSYSQEYQKLKKFVDNNISIHTNRAVYPYEQMTGDILINFSNLGEAPFSSISIFSAKYTGNCIYLNWNNHYYNTCEGLTIPINAFENTWKIPFAFYNLETTAGRYYAWKSGLRQLNIKFCNNDGLCYIKNLNFEKAPGKLKYVQIKPYSDVMVYGGINPVVIQGFDALPEEGKYQNEVKDLYYSYNLTTQPSIVKLSKNLIGSGENSLDWNFSSNLFFLKSSTENLGRQNFKIVGQISDNWKSVLTGVLEKFESKNIIIGAKSNLLSSEVEVNKSLKNISLPDPSYFASGGKYLVDHLWKIHIQPKLYDHNLKTPVYVYSDDHFKVGLVENGNFVSQNDFLITGDNGIDVWLVPTYKTGPFKITIKVPGIKDYVLTGNINPFPAKALWVNLNKYILQKPGIITGQVFGVDQYGNFVKNLDNLQIVSSDGIRVLKNGNDLKIKADKTGWIQFKLGNIETTIHIGVVRHFLPIDDGKVDIMYLSLFGNAWSNQDIQKIMSNSSKNLAITALLHHSDEIHKYNFIVSNSLQIYPSDSQANLIFSGHNTYLQSNKLLVNLNTNPFAGIKYFKNLDNIPEGTYYIPEALDDVIKENFIADGVLHINGNIVADFNNYYLANDLLIQYNDTLSNKLNRGVYDLILNKKLIGHIVFGQAVVDVSKLKIKFPYYTNIISFDGSSNDKNAFAISFSNGVYQYISKNTAWSEDDKGLGFRSNFKNISLFAAGENVGDATKHFENELMINWGDPFVKRIDKQEVIPAVKLSKTYGYEIYSDIAGGIKKVIPLDFNNDGLKDLVIVYNNGNIRLLKAYKGSHRFEDLGNLMVIGRPIKDVFAGDYNGDGYEDLFVEFQDGTIRVYKNNHGEFDVNPYPICLDLPKSDGLHLKYSQIFFKDMNHDGKTDIVVNDIAGNVKVYFGGYVSTSLTGCDANFKSRLQEKLVKSYAVKVDPNKKFADAGYVYREGLDSSDPLKQEQKTISNALKNGTLTDLPGDSNITPENYLQKVGASGVTNSKYALQSMPKDLSPSFVTDEVSFKKIDFLTGSDPVKVYKTMEDLNGGALVYGDKVKITVHVDNPFHKKIAYIEELKGPFGVISQDGKPILELNGISNNDIKYLSGAYSMFLFEVPQAQGSFTISYYAVYQGGSQVKIKVGDWNKDGYGDIKVFLKNGCIKGYDYFQGETGSPYMDFAYSFENLATKLKAKIDSLSTTKQLNQLTSQVSDLVKNHNISGLENLTNQYFGDTTKSIWSDGINSDEIASLNLQIGSDEDFSELKSKINDTLQGLCNGFSIGKSDCGGIPVPCNFAFFAPGIINACGCPLGKDPGTPIFWFPGTFSVPLPNGGCAGPIPMPYFVEKSSTPIENHAPRICMGPRFPSFIRLYLAPTLTRGLGFAACFGPYEFGMNAPPSPAGTIMGNCIVAAKMLKSKTCSKSKSQNADNELSDWMEDLNNGVCSDLPVKHRWYAPSPLDIPSAHNFYAASINPNIDINIGGLIDFSMSAHKINSLKDAEELLKGGVPFHLKVETGSFKGLIACVIKKWMNKQIQFIINQLTHMTIYVVMPDLSGISSFSSALDQKLNLLKNTNFDLLNSWTTGYNAKLGKNTLAAKIYKLFPNRKFLKDLNKDLSNPFYQLKVYLDSFPLVNVTLKTAVIKIPWIGKDEVDRQIAYLNQWLQTNKKILQTWMDLVRNTGDCEKTYKGDPERIQQCKQMAQNVLKAKAFIDSVQKNIQILAQYRDFPLKLYKYMHAVDFYMEQLACIINSYIELINGWLNRNAKIFEKRVDAIITIINVIKTYQIMINVFVDWKTTCGKCRADNGDLYDCTLSGLCPDLPVLPIPPFKLPDIFIDFSHINLGIDVVLPQIKFVPEPIGLLTLPNLPAAPNLSIVLPKLPLLPAPPKLPDLPSLPAVPKVELPNLPPPPMIPKLPNSLTASLKILKIIFWFRCIIKNGIGLVAEWNVKTRIEQLTARHNRLFPFDFMTIDFPSLPWKGFDVKLDMYLQYRLNFDQVYQFVQGIADSINSETSKAIDGMLEFNAKWNEKSSEWNLENTNLEIRPGAFNFKNLKKILFANSYYPSTKVAKADILTQINYLLSQQGKYYLSALPNSIYQKAFAVKKDVLSSLKVYPNYKGIEKVRREVLSLISKQRENLKELEQEIKNIGKTSIYSTKLASDIHPYSKKYVFSTSLFKANDFVYKKVNENFNIGKAYLTTYKKVFDKLAEKLPKYMLKHDKNYTLYQVMYHNTLKSLKVINSALGIKNNFAAGVSSQDNTVMVDPSQLMHGLYVKGDDDVYYNVLADKSKAQKIRQANTYQLVDLNNDGIDDLLWWDKYGVYVKYSNDDPNYQGVNYNNLYVYPHIVSNFADIVDKDGYVKILDSEFKIWSSKVPVRDLQNDGQDVSSLTLKWSADHSVNAYYLIYTSRPDILADIEKQYNYSSNFDYAGKTYSTYGLVLYDKKLGKINEVKAAQIKINGHKVKWLVYLPVNLEDIDPVVANLKKEIMQLHDKWKYFRVYKANLNLEINQLTVLSPYSNQDVASEQKLSDSQAPQVDISLYRNEVKLVGKGSNLNGYINTHYVLKAKWKDNVALAKTYITDSGYNLITTGNFVKIYEQYPKTLIYHFIGVDWLGNRIDQPVKVNITVPKITIKNVNSEEGIVEAKIPQDMDKTAVKFYVKYGNEIKELKSIQGKTIFTGGIGQTNFTGSLFKVADKLWIYSSDNKKIAYVGLADGIIHIQNPSYYVLADTENNTVVNHIYNSENIPIFTLQIPNQKLIGKPQIYSSDFELVPLTGGYYGKFDNGYCILDKDQNQCAIYISPNANFYVSSGYNYQFTAKYLPNELGNVEYIFYNIPIAVIKVQGKSVLTDNNKIFSVIVKPKSLLK